MHVSDGVLVSVRWRRYGKDRLYVTSADGSAVGWHDLVDDVAHPERPELADQLAAAVVVWRGLDVAPGAPLDVEVPPPPEESPAAAEPEPSPLLEPEPEWQDLAEVAPGAQARKQATALREAAPVKTFVARALGVHTEERAWRVGAVGEEKVADRLAKLVARDPRWRVLHAIPVGERGSDIDHLAIGPGGVFTINAKHHPGAKIWVGGDTFLVNGTRVPYVRNARHEARRAGRLLSVVTGREVSVTGVWCRCGRRRRREGTARRRARTLHRYDATRYTTGVIRSFRDTATELLWSRERSKSIDPRIERVALRKLVMLDAAETLDDLRVPPGNRLEALRGDRAGQHSIRINQQWRICFIWTDAGATDVEIVDYH